MKNNKYLMGLILLTLVCALPVRAQQLQELLSVHPSNVSKGENFLVLIEDVWSDSCGGEISVDLDTTTINITGTLLSAQEPAVCLTVLTPFKKLINPNDLLINILAISDGELEFADTITLNYFKDDGDGPERVLSRELTFEDADNQTQLIESGNWTTNSLDSSGLFIDQQRDILSLELLDYEQDGTPFWTVAAGGVNGNTFVGDLNSYIYTPVECVTAPCPQVQPRQVGRVKILLRDYNRLIVEFDNVLLSPRALEGFAFTYHRLLFNRSSQLSEVSLQTPDLTGNWVAGIRGDSINLEDDYRSVLIEFAGVVDQGGLERSVFDVFFTTPGIGVPVADYSINCEDARPADGLQGCFLDGFQYRGQGCQVSFPLSAIGERRITARAVCSDTDGNNTITTTFNMLKLN